MSSHNPVTSFADIRAILEAFPGPDLQAAGIVAAREAVLTKPAGSLGRLEEMTGWLAAWQGRAKPGMEHPRTAVFAGNHGVAARGVSVYPAEVTVQMVANFTAGGAAVNQLCRQMDADLRVYDLDLSTPTQDFTQNPAMTEAECAHAMAYGMMAVEPGLDVLCLGEMGIGNTTAASALCLALFGGTAADWVGPGSGVMGEQLRAKAAIVAEGVARHQDRQSDPLQLLAALGGRELAAIVGAIIAARLARTPVLLDGFVCTAAAAVLFALKDGALDHTQVAHCSAEPGHIRLISRINKRALLDLGMRLGEGSGATLAVGVLKAAVACHNGMASFDEAGVSGPA